MRVRIADVRIIYVSKDIGVKLWPKSTCPRCAGFVICCHTTFGGIFISDHEHFCIVIGRSELHDTGLPDYRDVADHRYTLFGSQLPTVEKHLGHVFDL